MPDAGENIRHTDAIQDSGWTAGTLATNWDGSSTYVWSRRWGQFVEVRARVRRKNSSKTIPSSGDTGNETVGTLGDSEHYPTSYYGNLCSGRSGRVAMGFAHTDGRVRLGSVDPGGGNISVGEFITLAGCYVVD